MNIFNEDFQDFLKALNANEVEYMLIGGYAVIAHGHHRTTGDMDIWVNKTSENYQKLLAAFRDFGMPVFDMTEENFLHNPEMDVFSFGVPPVSIDIMTRPKGLDFAPAYQRSEEHELNGIPVRVVQREDLIALKKASNRYKDRDDIKHLEDG